MATDGYFIKPEVVDYIIIHTGERYDFLLTANQAEKTNYIIRAETLEVNCETLERGALETNDAIAVLLYDGSSIDKARIQADYNTRRSCSMENVCKVANCPFKIYLNGSGYDCSNLHIDEMKLLVPTPEDELPDSKSVNLKSTWFFNFGFDSVEFTSTVNGRNFILPSTSLQTQGYRQIDSELCKDLSDECNLNEDDCTCVHMVSIASEFSGDTIRFVFSSLNTSTGFSFAHPIHLHGHSFHVVKVGYGSYDPSNNSIIGPTTVMGFNVTVKKPVARIVCNKVNDNIPTCWNYYRVFADGLDCYGNIIRRCITSPSRCFATRGTTGNIAGRNGSGHQ